MNLTIFQLKIIFSKYSEYFNLKIEEDSINLNNNKDSINLNNSEIVEKEIECFPIKKINLFKLLWKIINKL